MALAQPLAEFPIDSYSIFFLYSYKLYTFIPIHNLKHSSRLSPSPVSTNIIFYKFFKYNIATYFHS